MSIFKKAIQSLEAGRHSKIVLPELDDWQLLFEKELGRENRTSVMRAFINFIIDPKHADVVVPGQCIVEGKVYGHQSFVDGERILTSYMRKIFAIDKKTMVCHNRPLDDGNRFLVGIETTSGGRYWVDYLKKNEFMDKLEFDFVINRQLSDESGYYVPLCYKHLGFL